MYGTQRNKNNLQNQNRILQFTVVTHIVQGPSVHMIVRSLNRITFVQTHSQVVEKPSNSNLQLFVSVCLTTRSLLCVTAT